METIELYELQALHQAQTAIAQAQAQLQAITAIIVAHHNLQPGDNIGEDGKITRRAPE